jgi:hypothetical protein
MLMFAFSLPLRTSAWMHGPMWSVSIHNPPPPYAPPPHANSWGEGGGGVHFIEYLARNLPTYSMCTICHLADSGVNPLPFPPPPLPSCLTLCYTFSTTSQAITKDTGHTLRFFVNGQETNSVDSHEPGAVNHPITFCCRTNGGPTYLDYWQGQLRSVRYSKVKRTDSEILASGARG